MFDDGNGLFDGFDVCRVRREIRVVDEAAADGAVSQLADSGDEAFVSRCRWPDGTLSGPVRESVQLSGSEGSMVYRRIMAVLGATMALVASGLMVAAPAHADENNLVIQNVNSHLCLQPTNGSTATGVAIVQVACDPNSRAQRWARIPAPGGTQMFVNQNSGLCLDNQGGAVNNAAVMSWPCNNISNLRWSSTSGSPTITTIRSRVGGTNTHCLDVPGASTASGVAMQAYVCNGTVAQQFLLA